MSGVSLGEGLGVSLGDVGSGNGETGGLGVELRVRLAIGDRDTSNDVCGRRMFGSIYS